MDIIQTETQLHSQAAQFIFISTRQQQLHFSPPNVEAERGPLRVVHCIPYCYKVTSFGVEFRRRQSHNGLFQRPGILHWEAQVVVNIWGKKRERKDPFAALKAAITLPPAKRMKICAASAVCRWLWEEDGDTDPGRGGKGQQAGEQSWNKQGAALLEGDLSLCSHDIAFFKGELRQRQD